jgi:hypothetical protein
VALLLAIGFATGAFLYAGVWAYGDGFIFNRYSGEVIYVQLPEDDDVHLPARAPHHAHRETHAIARVALPALRAR